MKEKTNIRRVTKLKLTASQEILATDIKKQQRTANLIKKKIEHLQLVVNQRSHILVSSNYENQLSHVTLHCVKHNCTESPSVKYYKRNKFGLTCCAAENTSRGVIESNIRRGKKPPLTQNQLAEAKLTQDQNNAAKFTHKQERVTNLRKQKTDAFLALVQQRSHTMISGNYMDNSSIFVLFCTLHNNTQSTSVKVYKNNKTGLKCCAAALCDSRKKNNLMP